MRLRTPHVAAALALAALTACSAPTTPANEPAPAATAQAEPTPVDATPAVGTADTAEAPEPSPQPKPRTYTGTGAKVIRLKTPTTELMLIESVHNGAGHFALHSLTPEGDDDDLLANTVGRYHGTRLLGSDTPAFKVTADSPWKITIKPVVSAREWGTKPVRGRSDDVLALFPFSEGFQTITAKHTGQGHFAVHAYSTEAGEELLFNDVGRLDGETTLPDGTVLVQVTAEGPWTLTRTF